jgi:hypothetical protein
MADYLAPGCPWAEFELGKLISCEERLCAWVRQPMNTYSNLALALVAVLLFARATRTGSRTDRDFGFLAILIGIASSLSHASQIRALVFFDYASQFVLFAYLIRLNLERLGKFQGQKSRWPLTLGLSVIFMIPSVIDKRAGVPGFFLMAALYFLSEYRGFKQSPAKDYSAFKNSLATFAVAGLCFGLDTSGIICMPTKHLFQLHAVWHVLVACSLYQLASHFTAFESARPGFQRDL